MLCAIGPMEQPYKTTKYWPNCWLY